MRKLNLVPGLVVLAAVNLSAGEPAPGTDHTMTDAAYSRVIDGRTEPEKIPDQVRYGMFVKRYLIDIRDNLIQDLPARDDAILHALAVEDEQKSNAELRQYQESMRQLCQSRTIRDAVSLARENKRIVDEFYATGVRRYLGSFDALSPAGRKIVDSFIETTIVPNSQASVLDGVEWAKQHPDEYLHDLEIACHVAETGQLPVWLEVELDRRMQQDIPDVRESINNDTSGGAN